MMAEMIITDSEIAEFKMLCFDIASEPECGHGLLVIDQALVDHVPFVPGVVFTRIEDDENGDAQFEYQRRGGPRDR